jgi:hypothetical protein
MTLEDEGNMYLQNIWNISLCYPVVRCHIPEWCQYLISVLRQVLPGWLYGYIHNILEHCVKKLFLHILLLVCHRSNWHVHFWGRLYTLKWEGYFRNCTVLVHFDFNELSAPGNKRFHTVIYRIFTQLLTLILFGKCLVQILSWLQFCWFFSISPSNCQHITVDHPMAVPLRIHVYYHLNTQLYGLTYRQHCYMNYK